MELLQISYKFPEKDGLVAKNDQVKKTFEIIQIVSVKARNLSLGIFRRESARTAVKFEVVLRCNKEVPIRANHSVPECDFKENSAIVEKKRDNRRRERHGGKQVQGKIGRQIG